MGHIFELLSSRHGMYLKFTRRLHLHQGSKVKFLADAKTRGDVLVLEESIAV